MKKRENKVTIKWSVRFAYAIGLIATDGYLSIDGRHIVFTTKDYPLAHLFKDCLTINNKISMKVRGDEKIKKYYVVQFGDINFYNFLISIGITSKKSKTIKKVDFPKKYFPDFLRGCIDGDGSISVFNHKESKHPQLKIRLASASEDFLEWIHSELKRILCLKGGYIWKDNKKSVYTLSYAKADGGKILKFMYYDKNLPCLERKRRSAEKLGEW